jgi:hypothetical protein
MPGNIISAECVCGYETVLMPGSPEASPKTLVMVYLTDRRELDIEDSKIARRKQLQILEDPFVNFDEEDFDEWLESIKPMRECGPYLCPSCREQTLKLISSGNWD